MAKTKNKITLRRALVLALILLLTAGLSGGLIAAYYSDYFQGDINSTTSTLKIDVEQTVTLNGTATTLQEITTLTPGDVIVVSGTVTAAGSEAAWVRETVTITPSDSPIAAYITVYNVAIPQQDLLNDVSYSANLMALAEGATATQPRVLGGVGGSDPTQGAYTYLGTTYNYSYTIYFDKLAGNDTQNKSVKITLTTQALQFANNNASFPTEAAWSAIS